MKDSTIIILSFTAVAAIGLVAYFVTKPEPVKEEKESGVLSDLGLEDILPFVLA